jgi:hypothetical protein
MFEKASRLHPKQRLAPISNILLPFAAHDKQKSTERLVLQPARKRKLKQTIEIHQ